MYRNTFAEINLQNFTNNLRIVRNLIQEKTLILTAVKANAYGHGIVEISKHIQKNNLAHYLGVATLEEAVLLRKNQISLPILVLGLVLPNDENFKTILQYNIITTAADINYCNKLDEFCKINNSILKIHLKVDTGMGRIGCNFEDAPNICQRIMKLRNIELEGIFTHMPEAEIKPLEFNNQQINIFLNLLKELSNSGIDIPIKHMANSAAIINYPEIHLNMVRPGIMCYGYNPVPSNKIDLKPAMSFFTEITYTKFVKEGTSLSYGRNYILPKDSFISTLAVGYGDGYNRLLSNNANVLIDGRKYPVSGNVCMDQILINTGDQKFNPGTKVELFGEKIITALEISKSINTIPYEVTCSVSSRVPRIYYK